MKKEFSAGKLIKVDKKNILNFINKNEDNRNIFIYMYVLGRMFNDISFLIREYKLLLDEYREPLQNEMGTNHFGIFHGIFLQLNIRLIGILNEISLFLKNNDTKKVSKIVRDNYINNALLKDIDDNYIRISIKNFLKDGTFLDEESEENFARIRNNIGFHYLNSGGSYKHFSRKIKKVLENEKVDFLFFNELGGENINSYNRIFYSDLVDTFYLDDYLEKTKEPYRLLNKIIQPIAYILDILNKKILENVNR